MSLSRYAKRKDVNQEAIVKALRKHGVKVWILDTPCDLLLHYMGLFSCMEIKRDAKAKLTPAQEAFIRQTKCPVVWTEEDALRAVGAI